MSLKQLTVLKGGLKVGPSMAAGTSSFVALHAMIERIVMRGRQVQKMPATGFEIQEQQEGTLTCSNAIHIVACK